MTHSDNTLREARLLGDLRIFQAIHNDLKLHHEIVTLENGTKTWAYTYDGIDPYELEDRHFPTFLALISAHNKALLEKVVQALPKGIKQAVIPDMGQGVPYEFMQGYGRGEASGHNRALKDIRQALSKLKEGL